MEELLSLPVQPEKNPQDVLIKRFYQKAEFMQQFLSNEDQKGFVKQMHPSIHCYQVHLLKIGAWLSKVSMKNIVTHPILCDIDKSSIPLSILLGHVILFRKLLTIKALVSLKAKIETIISLLLDTLQPGIELILFILLSKYV
jgi:hypothetical protein